MKMTTRPAHLISHWAGVVSMLTGSVVITLSASPVARRRVSAPPMASSVVEAKNAVPFCSEAMIWISTMRTSRKRARRIQTSR